MYNWAGRNELLNLFIKKVSVNCFTWTSFLEKFNILYGIAPGKRKPHALYDHLHLGGKNCRKFITPNDLTK